MKWHFGYTDYQVLMQHITKIMNFHTLFRGNAQFVQKLTLELLMDFKQNHIKSWKYYIQKLELSKVFFTKVTKAHNYFFYDSAF